MNAKSTLFFILLLTTGCENRSENKSQKISDEAFNQSDLIRKIIVSKANLNPETFCFYENNSVYIKSYVEGRGYSEGLHLWTLKNDEILINRQDGRLYSAFKIKEQRLNSLLVLRGYSIDGKMFWQPDVLFIEK
ncbi:MAG: hypothetical protein NTV80_13675 [Verrucomicrobia bacterium]|nr:hypothetical protein [Verrucomicrobiota bacterium]